MQKQLQQVLDFHKKFDSGVGKKPQLIPENLGKHRYEIMKEEVQEYLEGIEKGDIHNIAKELADILYTVYGTIVTHGLQEKMEEIFDEVHASNMSKDLGEYKAIKGKAYFKAIKGKAYFKADMKKILGNIETE